MPANNELPLTDWVSVQCTVYTHAICDYTPYLSRQLEFFVTHSHYQNGSTKILSHVQLYANNKANGHRIPFFSS